MDGFPLAGHQDSTSRVSERGLLARALWPYPRYVNSVLFLPGTLVPRPPRIAPGKQPDRASRSTSSKPGQTLMVPEVNPCGLLRRPARRGRRRPDRRYWLVRRTELRLAGLYRRGGAYWYNGGWLYDDNWVVGFAVALVLYWGLATVSVRRQPAAHASCAGQQG